MNEDATKPHVWRYRDYVIRSLNDDKPFDRFVMDSWPVMNCPTPTPIL
jgi:hypothetical protein